jgi:hypothetical protein
VYRRASPPVYFDLNPGLALATVTQCFGRVCSWSAWLRVRRRRPHRWIDRSLRPSATALTDAIASVTVDAGSGDDDAPYRPRFDWQQLRDDYTRYRKGERWFAFDGCKFHADPQTLACMGPIEMAGQVTRATFGRSEGKVGIEIDRGRRDMITSEWTVAILDDDGHPITEWFPVDNLIRDGYAHAEIDMSPTDLPRLRNTHVGMRIDQRLLERRLRRQDHKGRFH